MKKQRFCKAQIMLILNYGEKDIRVQDPCRKHGMGSATFYKWLNKYDGVDASMICEMKATSAENRRLRRMYAEMNMQKDLLKETIEKS